MAIPAPVIAAGVQLGTQALGNMLGRKKKAPAAPNYSGLIDTLNQSGTRQQQMIGGLRPKLAPITDKFAADRADLTKGFTADIASKGRGLIDTLSTGADTIADMESEAAKSRILSAQPELNQNLRETLAASGMNRGGALLAGQTKIGQSLGREVGEANREISTSALRAKQDAVKTAFQTDAAAAERATGINADTMQAVLNSGREDLINELNALLEEERNRTGSIVGLQGQGMQDQYAADIAGKLRSQDLLDTLLKGGGNVLGQALASKYGAKEK